MSMDESFLENDLTQTLEQMLVPVKPPEEFRAHLRTGLHLASQQHTARRGYRRRHARVAWQHWWLAVVAFSASIAAGSVIAYLLRARFVHPRAL